MANTSRGGARSSKSRSKPADGNKRSRFKFQYRERTGDNIHKRSQGGGFESYFEPGLEIFKPRDKSNLIRILPATWENNPDNHFGFDLYVHQNIGDNNQAYLCPAKMLNKSCPICREARAIEGEDEEAAKKLWARRRVGIWLIERDDEDKGPQIWSMPQTVDKEVAKLSVNRRTGAVLLLDHPDEGYDIEFFKEGTGLKTSYSGLRVDHDPTPISDDPAQQDEWLEFIVGHQLPDTLIIQDFAYLNEVFSGETSGDDDGDDPDDDDDQYGDEGDGDGDDPDDDADDQNYDDGDDPEEGGDLDDEIPSDDNPEETTEEEYDEEDGDGDEPELEPEPEERPRQRPSREERNQGRETRTSRPKTSMAKPRTTAKSAAKPKPAARTGSKEARDKLRGMKEGARKPKPVSRSGKR